MIVQLTKVVETGGTEVLNDTLERERKCLKEQ